MAEPNDNAKLVADSSQSEELDSLVQETVSASKRSRRVLLFAVLASIMAFSSYWNSRPLGWAEQRFQVINKALQYHAQADTQLLKMADGTLMPEMHLTIKANRANIDTFLMVRNANTQEELKFLKDVYYNLKAGTFKFEIPILGIPFDVNDLGLFSGISLTLLLFLLWFCLEREGENVETSLKAAEQAGRLKHYYRRLSMTQVLTVPAREHRELSVFWLVLTKILYLLPLFVQYLIYLNDSATSSIVSPISEDATRTYNIINLVSIVVIVLMTIVCFVQIIKIDLLWTKYHRKIRVDG